MNLPTPMYDVMSKLQKSVFNTCYFTTSYMILNWTVGLLLTGSRSMRLRNAVRPILYIIAETSPICSTLINHTATPNSTISSNISIPAEPIVADGGKQLPSGAKSQNKFLDIENIVQILTEDYIDPPQCVPRGLKENVYFVVDNKENLQRRQNGQLSQFWDDCGPWLSGGPSNKTLGQIHVTAGVFKNLSVTRKTTGDHPLFLGPMYLHGHSDYESYRQFFDHLAMKLEGTTSQPVTGSDEERSICKAMESAFPGGGRLSCTRHLQGNAQEYLKNDSTARRACLRRSSEGQQ